MTRRLSTLNLVSSDGRRKSARIQVDRPERAPPLAGRDAPGVPSAQMPEGDTIHYAANRIRPVLEGHVPDALETPHPRFGRDRWPERLAGRAVRSVDAHGKHLFLRFEGGLTIHSHLRMTGSWRVVTARARGRPRSRARRGCGSAAAIARCSSSTARCSS